MFFSRFTFIKKQIKSILHGLMIILGKRNYINSNQNYQILQSKHLHTFFGYYDKTPFSKNGKIILAMVTDKKIGSINKPSLAQIGYFNFSRPTEFISVGETTTWCWQLGARLMWFGDSQNKIIYNKIINDGYGSVIQRINDKSIIKKLNFPIYDVDKNFEYGLSLNFSRLGRLRPGYGYVNFPDDTNEQSYMCDDGIWRCDFKNNKKDLIIDLQSIVNFKFPHNPKNIEHYINHLSINPSGDRFLFYHVYNYKGQRLTRGITADLNGNKLYLLNEGRTISHYSWKSDNELLITGQGRNGFGYYLIRDKSNKINQIAEGLLNKDGHPSFISNSGIITDTYPQPIFNEQELLTYDSKNKLKTIAQIHSSFNLKGEYKCDLHPRVNFNNNKVAVDFCTKNRRKIAVFNI